VALATEITTGAGSAWEKAVRIHEWVHDHLAKRPVASLPSALAVLDAKEGDCNEHTVLAVALLRAAGVPARTVVGVVWSADMGGFGYHAWPEVWLGRWVWMDPTFGQEIADATHIKLLDGGVERWPELAAFLGQLEIEVLEVT
jgi:transglutaminase-like putative cysteine protease